MKRPLILLLTLVVAGPLVILGAQSPASAAACNNPKFTTSSPNAMWTQGRYIVHNNMWNASSYDMWQRLAACTYRNWRVTATADNSAGDGAVKSYPNVHRDYHNWSTGHEPRVTKFRTIRSRWKARTPGVGIYNAAYDIWLNGVPGQHEVMIWTDNRKQVPAGSVVKRSVKLGKYRWKVWASRDNGYIAFVPKRRLTHGTIAIRRMLGWLIQKRRLDRDVTLGQICFGFEIVSTGGEPARFKVDRFKVISRRK
ncbi:hypothetical protein FXB39_10975 [Nocardioides sp. BGMRC 2183]|nr:hypothetical protein FXB39_10975 [Nocardioides sp. BGMRC 2183]